MSSGQYVNDIDKKCPYYSGSHKLKCAINPSLPCKDCDEASADFKADSSAQIDPDRYNITIQSNFMWAEGMVMGVDSGSSGDYTAIVSGTRNEDGSVSFNTAEVRANVSGIEAAIAKIQETISRSMGIPAHLLESGAANYEDF
jgi:hypothetical protein